MNSIPRILTLATLLSFAHALFRIFGGPLEREVDNISDLMFSDRGTKDAKGNWSDDQIRDAMTND
jgi:hypothetical protein